MTENTSGHAQTTESEDTAANTAFQKFDELFESLDEAEQGVISSMVRASLLHAAGKFEGEKVANVPGAIDGLAIDDYVAGLTARNAPRLVRSLGLPGSLAAYSIPGCNASALVALRTQFVR